MKNVDKKHIITKVDKNLFCKLEIRTGGEFIHRPIIKNKQLNFIRF